MEARQTLKGTSVSRGLMVVVAIAATAGIAAIGALATKDLGGSQSNVSNVQAPKALPLRQDNDYPVIAPKALPLRQDNDYPVIASPVLIDRGAERGFVQTHNGRMGGTIDSAGALGDDNGPDSDLTRVLPVSGSTELPLWLQQEMGTSQQSTDKIIVDQGYVDQYLAYNPGWDARSVREGHGP